jgi:hypothetical protein
MVTSCTKSFNEFKLPNTLATSQSASAGQGPDLHNFGHPWSTVPTGFWWNGGGGGGYCSLRGTKILTVDGERSIEDLAIGICCRQCSVAGVPSNGSDTIVARRAIRPSHWLSPRCWFVSPAPLSLPMSRMPIFM